MACVMSCVESRHVVSFHFISCRVIGGWMNHSATRDAKSMAFRARFLSMVSHIVVLKRLRAFASALSRARPARDRRVRRGDVESSVERFDAWGRRRVETTRGLGGVSHRRRRRSRRTRRSRRRRRTRRRDDARARRRGTSPKRRRAVVNADERRCEETHRRRRRRRAGPSPRARCASSSARRLRRRRRRRRRRVETRISWTWRRIRKTRAETARRAREVDDEDDDDETWRVRVSKKASIVETSTRREVMTRGEGKQKGDEAAPRASTVARRVARARHGGDGRDSDSGGR